MPSSLSALRLATFAPELTFMGALPASTCRSRAVAAAFVELLSMSWQAPATLPTSLLTGETELWWGQAAGGSTMNMQNCRRERR